MIKNKKSKNEYLNISFDTTFVNFKIALLTGQCLGWVHDAPQCFTTTMKITVSSRYAIGNGNELVPTVSGEII